MINLKNISITNDGALKRISVSYDELSDEGKTISTNNRVSRVVTDDLILDNIASIENFVNTVIEEV
jgi:hypothetical protein